MKIVVAGAGAAGIFSSLLLARYGHQVLLLEAAPQIAPLLRGFSRQGLQFDTGFHQSGVLSKNGILRRYLHFIDVLQHLKLVPYRKDCCELFRFILDDRPEDICIPQGLRSAADTLSGLWPCHRDFITGLFQDIGSAFTHSPFVDPNRMSFEKLTLPPTGSIANHLRAGLPPKLKTLLCGGAFFYGVPPERGAFNDLALITNSMLDGVHGIAGGGLSLVRAFEQALNKSGVEVRLRSKLSSIRLHSNKSIASVQTEDGNEVACEACIFTGHPGQLPGLLPTGALRPAKVRQLSSLEETHKCFMLFGSTKSDFLLGRSVFLCFTADIDEAYRNLDPGHTVLHVTCGTPTQDGSYPVCIVAGITDNMVKEREKYFHSTGSRAEWKKAFEARILSLIQRHLPEISDLLVLDSADDQTMRKWVHGSSGSIYGVLHSKDTFPLLPFTRIKNLYLAGQHVTLPGLLGAFISGAIACGSVIGYKKLFADLACVNAE